VIALGMSLGFLPWNKPEAKIFMGDTGALLLGLIMAASTMVVGGRSDQQYSGQAFFFYAPLFIPLLILGVPILDTAWSIVRRASRRKGVATADKDHLHHRLVRLGHGDWRSIVILWAWTALLSAFVLYPTYTGQGNGIVPFGIAASLLLLYTVLHPATRRRDQIDLDAAVAAAPSSADDGDGAEPVLEPVGAGTAAGSRRPSRRRQGRAGTTPPPGKFRRSRASSRRQGPG
jgi:UDP-GlcNAc:undecaprenyl-phosphate GlcNAc-1-phosphate transferase